MAQREAGIRVTIKNAAFLAGMRRMVGTAQATGVKMGAALSAPMKSAAIAGLGSVKRSMGGLMGAMKGHMKTVATFGGAFAMGKMISDAAQAQHLYRNIANQINRAAGNAETWKSVQATIEPIALRTGQSISEMAKAYRTVFAATGDLEYTKATMEAIGTAATATGEDAGQLAMAMQLAARKFGVGSEDAEETMARFIEKIGVGGMSLDDLNGRFAVMAGEAAAAGMKGKEGISMLLGTMLKLDSSIGEKAAPGLKAMFQYIKDNTAQLEALQKKAGIEFEPDLTAFEKVRKMLETEKGRVAAQLTFTADSRVVYDTLAQPFEDAYAKAVEAGRTQEAATKEGLEAYDKAMKDMTKSNAKYSDLQAQAAERLREDPTVQMRNALNRLSQAFTKKEMLDALERVAKVMPQVADYFVRFMEVLTKHPLLVGGGLIGMKFGMTFAGGMLADAGAKIGTKAGLSFITIAKRDIGKMGAWRTAATGFGIAAGAIMAYEIGKAMIDNAYKARDILEGEAAAGAARAAAATGRHVPIERKRAALAEVSAKIAKVEKARGGAVDIFEHVVHPLAAVFTDVEHPAERTAKSLSSLMEEQGKLMTQIRAMESAQKKQKDGAGKVTTQFELLGTELGLSIEEVKKFRKEMAGGTGKGPPKKLPKGGGESQTD